ncbi:ABC transporter ATP-binding protein [Glutamicibacter uratoxydans]|uniref:ABC transporter ATP-binding protein n=1 Tax=Glutamicibacter uratoxydans TaxID=43667 RepID=UPI003D6EC594
MGQLILEVSGLTKRYGKVRALDGLDLTVQPGQVHGFLGPNGAGKTTTLRVLLGLLRADSGRVRLFGQDPWRRAASLHQRLAYVPSDVMLWPGLTGGEIIDLLSSLHGRVNERRRTRLLERFELDPTRKAHTYSRGNRQKVVLVAALACEVELLLLDEPSTGLDPLMELVFQQAIEEAADRGTAVLLSSHLLPEVEKLCSQITIIKQGKTVESGTLTQLRQLTRSHIALSAAVDAGALRSLSGVDDVRQDGQLYRFSIDHREIPRLLRLLADREVTSFSCTPPSLEELFLHHYRTEAGVQ